MESGLHLGTLLNEELLIQNFPHLIKKYCYGKKIHYFLHKK